MRRIAICLTLAFGSGLGLWLSDLRPAWAEDAPPASSGSGSTTESASGSDLAPLTAQEFDDYTRGKTLSYSMWGQEYGKEQYFANRRVVWAFSGEECHWGTWHEEAGNICFVYDDDPTLKCWQFVKGEKGLRATFLGDGSNTELAEVAQSTEGLGCPGPDVGA